MLLRQGGNFRCFLAWLMLFGSKFVRLGALDLVLDDRVKFTGPLGGVKISIGRIAIVEWLSSSAQSFARRLPSLSRAIFEAQVQAWGFLLTLTLLAQGEASLAQDLEPRSYTNIPVGMNFLAVGFAHSEGSVLVDPSIELQNANISLQGPLAGYARSIRLFDRSAKFDAGIANVCLKGSADYEGDRVSRDVCGWSDARLRLTVNLLGAPALSMKDYAEYRQDLVVGASLELLVPVGDYDPDRLVNIGTNRWATRLEVGASKAVQRWLFEASLGTTVFAENDDFFGGRRRKQMPVSAVQFHVVRRFKSGVWMALDSTWYGGGETETDGLDNANLMSNTRFGLTISVPVNRRHSLKINASTGVQTRTGSDFDVASVIWQYRWGPQP